MSADKRKSLQIETAYLRLACRESGMATNVMWARARTKFLDKMAERGLITYKTVGFGGRKTVTTAFATPAGHTRLAETLKRFGPEYGQPAAISRIEPARGHLRPRPFDLTPRHVKAEMAKVLKERSKRSLELITGALRRRKAAEDTAATGAAA